MLLNVLVRNPKVTNVHTKVCLNVQQNPGRGAKVVETRVRRKSSGGTVVIHHPTGQGLSATLQVPITLHSAWTMANGRDPRKYLEQMSADLGNHARYLQQRDLQGLEHFSHSTGGLTRRPLLPAARIAVAPTGLGLQAEGNTLVIMPLTISVPLKFRQGYLNLLILHYQIKL